MKELKIYVLGGSASSAHALKESPAWPQILANKYPQFELSSESFGGLTLVQSINKLNAIDPVDVVILHFGTSIGWPSAVVDLGHKFGMDFHSEFAFHQPAVKSKKLGYGLLKNKVRMHIRNLVKYILFIFGLYKPRINPREIGDQISAVLDLVEGKAKKVIWIQHQAISDRRTSVERHSYTNFYNRIVADIKARKPVWLELLELPDSFIIPENYLHDSVHLSALGHRRLAKLIDIILVQFFKTIADLPRKRENS